MYIVRLFIKRPPRDLVAEQRSADGLLEQNVAGIDQDDLRTKFFDHEHAIFSTSSHHRNDIIVFDRKSRHPVFGISQGLEAVGFEGGFIMILPDIVEVLRRDIGGGDPGVIEGAGIERGVDQPSINRTFDGVQLEWVECEDQIHITPQQVHIRNLAAFVGLALQKSVDRLLLGEVGGVCIKLSRNRWNDLITQGSLGIQGCLKK
jgi:hypothetical protein